MAESKCLWAHVKYLRDGVLSKVPEHFIQFDFKNKSWDPQAMYWVFWSSVVDDSPTKMLEREGVLQVPHIENDQATEEAAYYRATILCVADSLEALSVMIEGTRQRSVPLKLLQEASFSLPSSSFESSTNSKINAKSKGKKTDNSSKRRGNEVATYSKKRPASNEKSSKDNIPALTESGPEIDVKKARRTGAVLIAEELANLLTPDPPRGSCLSEEAGASKCVSEKQVKLAHEVQDTLPRKKRLAGQQAVKKFKKSSGGSESSSDGLDDSEFKLMTPTKYLNVLEQTEDYKREISTLRSYNMKLQKHLFEALEANSKCTCNNQGVADTLLPKGVRVNKELFASEKHDKGIISSRAVTNLDFRSQPSKVAQQTASSAMVVPLLPTREEIDCAAPVVAPLPTRAEIDCDNTDFARIDDCPTSDLEDHVSFHEEESRQETLSPSASEPIDIFTPWKWPHLPQTYELMPGRVLPKDRLATDFWPLPKGKHGDQPFVKNAAAWLFSEQTLIDKKVVGKRPPESNKANKKKKTDVCSPPAKPWSPTDDHLNPAGLAAIRDFLAFRIKKEGGPDNSEELKERLKHVNYYIQQKKKSLRSAPGLAGSKAAASTP